MARIITFGEIMMRLNPREYDRIVQANEFAVSYAGSEANVAVSLACSGMEAAFVSRVPAHEVGQSSVNALRRYGVDTSLILRGGSRLGIYFVEKGASQRASKVIYDRAASAIACAKRSDFDWDAIFAGAHWFHFSGITPALGGELPAICADACRAAKAHGVTISCDINYRKNLWPRQEARSIMTRLMEYVDVCIANEEDAENVFGIHADSTDVAQGKLNQEGYIQVARQLTERFGLSHVAITLRGSFSASINEWGAMLYENAEAFFSPRYTVHIVDRVGGGDSFAGSLIYALLKPLGPQEAVHYAAAASCLKHTIEQDFNLISVDEARSLAAGNASGRVQR